MWSNGSGTFLTCGSGKSSKPALSLEIWIRLCQHHGFFNHIHRVRSAKWLPSDAPPPPPSETQRDTIDNGINVKIAFFSANERSERERERERETKMKGKEKGKGKLEVKLRQKRKKIANAPAGNRTRDPSKRGWCSTIELPLPFPASSFPFLFLSLPLPFPLPPIATFRLR